MATTDDNPGTTFEKSLARDYLESICIAVIFALFVRTFVIQAFKIPSGSMEDNLLVGDHILVDKFAFAPHLAWMEGILPYRAVRHEDVFVFKFPKDPARDFIKRVIGTGDDTIEVRRGQVYRNQQQLDEPYVFIKSPPNTPGTSADLAWRQVRDNMLPMRLSTGQYFAMGDNRLNSDDSRYWGTVPGEHVKGKALFIYWSFDVTERCKVVEVNGTATSAERMHCLGYTALHFFDRSRWLRTGRIIR